VTLLYTVRTSHPDSVWTINLPLIFVEFGSTLFSLRFLPLQIN